VPLHEAVANSTRPRLSLTESRASFSMGRKGVMAGASEGPQAGILGPLDRRPANTRIAFLTKLHLSVDPFHSRLWLPPFSFPGSPPASTS
jgi:hypothetical protein